MKLTDLTAAGIAYLAKLYEQAVTQNLDVGEIRSFLTRKGVAVTKAEVIDHLDNVFTYHGYATANPAKPALTYEEFDAQMRKPARRLPAAQLSHGQDRKTVPAGSAKIYQTAC